MDREYARNCPTVTSVAIIANGRDNDTQCLGRSSSLQVKFGRRSQPISKRPAGIDFHSALIETAGAAGAGTGGAATTGWTRLGGGGAGCAGASTGTGRDFAVRGDDFAAPDFTASMRLRMIDARRRDGARGSIRAGRSPSPDLRNTSPLAGLPSSG